MNKKRFWYVFIKDILHRSLHGKIDIFAASLAFFMVFALGPLSVLVIMILEAVLRNPNAKTYILGQADIYIGQPAVELVNSFMFHLESIQHSQTITIISIIVLLFTAAGFFSNMRGSLNTIFGVDKKTSIKRDIMKRILSILLLVGIALLVIVSTLFNTMMVKVDDILMKKTYLSSYIVSPLYFILSIVIIALFLAAIYHTLPDRRVRWRYLVSGALAASFLFELGKTLFEWYIGNINFTSIYGTAGSIMILMLWTYFSAILFYFGAVVSRSHEEAAKKQCG